MLCAELSCLGTRRKEKHYCFLSITHLRTWGPWTSPGMPMWSSLCALISWPFAHDKGGWKRWGWEFQLQLPTDVSRSLSLALCALEKCSLMCDNVISVYAKSLKNCKLGAEAVAQLIGHSLAWGKSRAQAPALNNQIDWCVPDITVLGRERNEVHSHPQLHRKFKASLDQQPCQKTDTKSKASMLRGIRVSCLWCFSVLWAEFSVPTFRSQGW